MRIIAWSTLRDYAKTKVGPKQRPALTAALIDWRSEVKAADWKKPSDVKMSYGSASILKDGRVVFNICGNSYRIVTQVNYKWSVVYIRFVGTHDEYNAIDAQTI
jgi:mRNA interferase HigB